MNRKKTNTTIPKGRHLRFQVQEVRARNVRNAYDERHFIGQSYATRAAIYDVDSLLYIYVDVYEGTDELYRPRESAQIKIKIGQKEFTFEDANELLKQLEKDGNDNDD